MASTSNEVTEHIDNKMSEFKQTVEDNDLITDELLSEQLNGLDWQKYELTNDDGTIKIVNLESNVEKLNEMTETVFFYTTNTPGLPSDVSSAGFLIVYARKGDSPIKHVYQPYSQNKIVVRNYYNEWSEWQKISQTQSDTGWVPFKIINGGRTNTAYDY
ncbi:pyocin knob domain-containing protein [Staphylococcus pseudoxylosus]|uniref:pyocin knob domain-containing protein n=1 Tax=Staphylococcus pseudoxylosus TaxID=2282419 RepID=UPI002DB7665B|nr:pyocin knob domain-containing protein [Staphylococcus pseudoxylosus]MEB5784150.1 pyocin knob domain-containing protein [Staphylococcus pseudoxylosus]